MLNLFTKLWNDDQGALISAEYLFVATILVIGIITGLVAVRAAIVTELSELANAYLALSQGYAFSGLSGCCATTDGSEATDSPSLVTQPICSPPSNSSLIDRLPCG